MQWAVDLPAAERIVGVPGGLARAVGIEGDDRVNRRVVTLDAAEVRLEGFHGAHLTVLHPPGQHAGRHLTELAPTIAGFRHRSSTYECDVATASPKGWGRETAPVPALCRCEVPGSRHTPRGRLQ